MSDARETLRSLKAWIMSCGTEDAGKYEPPSEADAVAAIDEVLAENERLRKEWDEAHAANELLLDTKHQLRAQALSMTVYAQGQEARIEAAVKALKGGK